MNSCAFLKLEAQGGKPVKGNGQKITAADMLPTWNYLVVVLDLDDQK